MSESGKNEAVLKKTYEISYALWRITANLYERALAEGLRKKAAEMIAFAADGNWLAVQRSIPAMEFLIKFGVDVGTIGIGNGETVFYEIGNLKNMIAAINELSDQMIENGIGNKDIYLGDIFADSESNEVIKPDPVPLETFLNDSGIAIEPNYQQANEIGNQKAEMRQSAILERIRQIGNCRLGDIQSILSEVSERTIRYDLESLVQRNLVERVGTGGRSVFYRIPRSSNPQ